MTVLITEPEFYQSEQIKKLKRVFKKILLEEIKTREKLIQFINERSVSVLFTKIGFMHDKNFFKMCPRLKVIATPTTGLTHIDLESAALNEINVYSLKGEYDLLSAIPSTAEHAWHLLLAIARRSADYSKIVDEGKWVRKGLESMQLHGKSVGIIGFGRLGGMIASFADAFGMPCSYFDILDKKREDILKAKKTTLSELLRSSDVIFLSANYSQKYHKMISFNEFSMMKKGVIFINISRGEFVDELALRDAITDSKFFGVGLDVLYDDSNWDGEIPHYNVMNDIIRSHNNVIISPHVGGYSLEAIQKTRDFIVDKVLRNWEQ